MTKELTIVETRGFLRYQKGPVSLESERRKAIIIVEEVERTVNHFKNKWLKDATDDHVDFKYVNHDIAVIITESHYKHQ
jgi:hypothetical protein